MVARMACWQHHELRCAPKVSKTMILHYKFGASGPQSRSQSLRSPWQAVSVPLDQWSVYFWLIRSFKDPAFTGSILVCGPLLHHVLLSRFLIAGQGERKLWERDWRPWEIKRQSACPSVFSWSKPKKERSCLAKSISQERKENDEGRRNWNNFWRWRELWSSKWKSSQ